MSDQIVTVDVREDIQRGREPFSKIMGAVAALRSDEQFLLIAPFQPVPLFEVMKRHGFQHQARSLGNGDWEVLFTREGKTEGGSQKLEDGNFRTPNSAPQPPTSVADVDARGLEPPQPLVIILEATAGLPDGAMLRARTDRRPIHLYSHLAERGFIAETTEQSDGSFLTQIRRR